MVCKDPQELSVGDAQKDHPQGDSVDKDHPQNNPSDIILKNQQNPTTDNIREDPQDKSKGAIRKTCPQITSIDSTKEPPHNSDIISSDEDTNQYETITIEEETNTDLEKESQVDDNRTEDYQIKSGKVKTGIEDIESSDNSDYQNSEEAALVKKASESHELEVTVVESAEEIKKLCIEHRQNLDRELRKKNAFLADKKNLEAELRKKNALLADKQNLEAELTRKNALLAYKQNLEAELTRKDALLADKQNLETELMRKNILLVVTQNQVEEFIRKNTCLANRRKLEKAEQQRKEQELSDLRSELELVEKAKETIRLNAEAERVKK